MEKYINKHNENIELIKIIKRLSKEELRSYKKKRKQKYLYDKLVKILIFNIIKNSFSIRRSISRKNKFN